MAEQATI